MRTDKIQIVLDTIVKSIDDLSKKIDLNDREYKNYRRKTHECELITHSALKEIQLNLQNFNDASKNPKSDNNKKILIPVLFSLIVTLIVLSTFLYLNMDHKEEYFYKYQLVKHFKANPQQVDEIYYDYEDEIKTKVDSILESK